MTSAVPAHLRAPGSAPGQPTEPGVAEPVTIQAVAPGSGQSVGFEVDPVARQAARAEEGRDASPALDVAAAAAPAPDNAGGGAHLPVPRNDTRTHVYQPHCRRWRAADLASAAP